MKKILVLAAAVASVALTAQAFPRIPEESVDLLWHAGRNQFTIRYVLEDGPAVVIADIFTNGVPLAAEVVTNFTGRTPGTPADANRRVESGPRMIVWRNCPGELAAACAEKSVSVKLTAYPLSSPPDYLAIDLVESNTVYYCASEERLPLGVSNALYKTDLLLMRKVPSCGATWRMGSTTTLYDSEDLHTVTFTNRDFYIGVYQVTQRQFERVTGSNPSYHASEADSPRRPVENVSYGTVRGTWGTAKPSDTLFIGLLRRHSGLAVDLPLDAQWEFACRAGTTSDFNDGTNLDVGSSGADAGWYSSNSGGVTHEVGMKKPNKWGLYDMHGNVWELIRDGWTRHLGTDPVLEPVNAGYGGIIRGGSAIGNDSVEARSSRRNDYSSGAINKLGFRLGCDGVAE